MVIINTKSTTPMFTLSSQISIIKIIRHNKFIAAVSRKLYDMRIEQNTADLALAAELLEVRTGTRLA